MGASRAAIVIAALAAILVGGCGGGGGSSDELASLVPADAPVYVESVVRPEGEQRDAIESLSSRIAGIDDPGAAIVQRIDAQLAETGVTYEDDIAPWLGERAATFFRSFDGEPPPFAAIFETTDTGAAQDFLDKVAGASPGIKQTTYNGVQYLEEPDEAGGGAVGLVDDFLVFGTVDGFKAAVDASTGDSLGDTSAFQDGTASLPAANVALGYVDGRQAAEQLTGTPTNPLEAAVLKATLQTVVNGPATFAISAAPDSATVDLSLPNAVAAKLSSGDVLSHAPADAWFAVGLGDVGGVLGSALNVADAFHIPSVESRLKDLTGVDPNQVVAWIRDGYGFVGGTSKKTINIGGVATTADRHASAKAIDALRKRFQQDADAKLGPPPQGADAGFSASAPESPQAIQVGQFGNQVVGALGPGQPAEDALHPQHPLGDDPTFQAGEDGLGSDFSPLAFVRLSPFFVVAEKGGSANDPDFIAAKPYLEKLDYLIAGTSGDDDRSTVRFVVGVK